MLAGLKEFAATFWCMMAHAAYWKPKGGTIDCRGVQLSTRFVCERCEREHEVAL